MPTATNGDVALHYATDGTGTPVVFVPEAGLGGWSWSFQHGAVARRHRSVVWDLRGTGHSDSPPGPYDLPTLASDLEAILRAILGEVDARAAHVVGAGLGGAIALWAARGSSRIASLTLFGTGARAADFDLDPLFAPPDDPTAGRAALERALSADFVRNQPELLETLVEWRAEGDADEAGFRAQIAALDDFDVTEWGYEVTQPALVCHGTRDELVDPEGGERLADSLPRGRFEPVEGSGHLVGIDASRAVTDELLAHLQSVEEG